MASKKFMSDQGGNFGGAGATGTWSDTENQSAAETARLKRSGTTENQSAAETLRLARHTPPVKSNVPNPPTEEKNAYVHEENNIIPSAADTRLKFNFQSNILDNYDVVTYHWKLFIVPLAVTRSGEITNLATQTIIAESGVSDLTIDNVQIRSITTPGLESGTGTSTGIKFELVEPSGAGLMDKIFYESIALGIGNWMDNPYYLQLEFRGRTADTSESENSGTPGAIGGLKWIWPLSITNVSCKVKEVGSRYEFTSILYSELAQANVNSMLQQAIVLRNLTTFGDAMKQLADILNGDQILKLIGTYSIPDLFSIIVDPKIEGYKITPPTNNTDSARAGDYSISGPKTATFNMGTSLDKIVDSLLANTAEYQKSLVGSSTPGGDTMCRPAEVSQMKKFWRVITETRPLEFDARRETNAKEFTFFIIEYDLAVIDGIEPPESTLSQTIEAKRKRLATYIKKSILRKKYNYMFTGLNDQVINFDLDMKFAYGVAKARMAGVYSNLAMSDKGPVTQDNSANEASVTESLMKAIAFQNNSGSASSTQGQLAYYDAKNKIAVSSLSDEEKARYTTLLEQSKPENRLTYLSSVRESGGIDNNGQLVKARSRATSIAKPLTEFGFDGKFISDVDIDSKVAKDMYSEYLNVTKGKLRPKAKYEGIQDKAIGLGVESSSNSGIQKLSSQFSSAMHGGADVSLVHVKINIKGDPFWLFPQPTIGDKHQLYNSLKPRNEAIKYIRDAHFSYTDAINIYGTDNFIVVRFRTPRIFNTDANTADGDSAFTEIESFSGVYKVIGITSKFEQGKFSHELECNLDDHLNIKDFSKELDEIVSHEDAPGTVKDIVTNNKYTMPVTVTKTDKLPPTGAGAGRGFVNPVLPSAAGAGRGFVNPPLSNIPTEQDNIIGGLPPYYGI